MGFQVACESENVFAHSNARIVRFNFPLDTL